MLLSAVYTLREAFLFFLSHTTSGETFILFPSLIVGAVPHRESGKEIDTEKDAEFVRRVRDGDRAAYVSLFGKYGDDIYRYCYYFLSKRKEPEEDAQDAMKEAFVKCLENINYLREGSSFFPYLKRTAFTTCMDILRDRQSLDDPSTEGNPGDVQNYPMTTAGGDTPEEKSISREIQSDVRKAMDRLPENHRRAIILVHFMEYSYAEAATMMNADKGDIRNWVHRGVTKLDPRCQ